MTDGSGFMSQDLAELIPAVSSGELLAGLFGHGVMWPSTPAQVRTVVKVGCLLALVAGVR